MLVLVVLQALVRVLLDVQNCVQVPQGVGLVLVQALALVVQKVYPDTVPQRGLHYRAGGLRF